MAYTRPRASGHVYAIHHSLPCYIYYIQMFTCAYLQFIIGLFKFMIQKVKHFNHSYNTDSLFLLPSIERVPKNKNLINLIIILLFISLPTGPERKSELHAYIQMFTCTYLQFIIGLFKFMIQKVKHFNHSYNTDSLFLLLTIERVAKNKSLIDLIISFISNTFFLLSSFSSSLPFSFS